MTGTLSFWVTAAMIPIAQKKRVNAVAIIGTSSPERMFISISVSLFFISVILGFDITVNNNRYEIVGTKLPRWAGNIGANLNMTFNQYGEISIGINAQMRDNYNNISAMIRAAMRF